MKITKKILVIGVLLLFILSLAGCANTAKVKEELCGEWGYTVQSINGPCYQIYTFDDDGTYEAVWINQNAPSKSSESEGTYKITGSKIILTEDNGELDTNIEYTFVNGKLNLVDKHSDNSGNRELLKLD